MDRSKLLSDEDPDIYDQADTDDLELDFNLNWNTDERPTGHDGKFYERLEHDIAEAWRKELDAEDALVTVNEDDNPYYWDDTQPTNEEDDYE